MNSKEFQRSKKICNASQSLLATLKKRRTRWGRVEGKKIIRAFLERDEEIGFKEKRNGSRDIS